MGRGPGDPRAGPQCGPWHERQQPARGQPGLPQGDRVGRVPQAKPGALRHRRSVDASPKTGGRGHRPDLSGLRTGTRREPLAGQPAQTADRTWPPDPSVPSESSTLAPNSRNEPQKCGWASEAPAGPEQVRTRRLRTAGFTAWTRRLRHSLPDTASAPVAPVGETGRSPRPAGRPTGGAAGRLRERGRGRGETGSPRDTEKIHIPTERRGLLCVAPGHHRGHRCSPAFAGWRQARDV